MALNIKNPEVEKLATEVAILACETKTAAVRLALLERRDRLKVRGVNAGGREPLRTYLEQNVWPLIPVDLLGKVITREEEDEILGYGPEGY